MMDTHVPPCRVRAQARYAIIALLVALFAAFGAPAARATAWVTVSGPSTLCQGANGRWTAQVSVSGCENPPSGYSYAWTVDGSYAGSYSYLDYNITSPGNHTVACSVSTSCGSGSGSASVYVTSGAVTISSLTYSPTSPTTCDMVTFGVSASSGCGSTLSYSWNFGDGFYGTGASPTHTYPNNGTYTVTVTASTSSGASATRTATIAVTAGTPTVTVGSITSSKNPSTTCDVVTFSASAYGNSCSQGAISYAWTFGDGGSATGATVTHRFTTPSTGTGYLVTVTASNSTATGTATLRQTVNQGPAEGITVAASASPSAPSTCNTVTFTASGTENCTQGASISYSWAFGDGTNGTGSSATHLYTVPGTYTATVTATDGTNTGQKTVTVTVKSAVTVSSITAQPATATPCDLITFTASATQACGASLTYAWDFGDNATATGVSATHRYASPGTYTVKVTASDGNTTGQLTKSVTVNSPLTVSANATASPSTCVPCDDVTLSVNATLACGGPMTYDWDFGDLSPHSTLASPKHHYLTPGTYTARVTVQAGGYSGTASVTITANDGPHPGITVSSLDVSPGTPTSCDQVTLTANATENCGGSASFTYSWSLDGGVSWTTPNSSKTYKTALPAGTVNLQVRVSDGTYTGVGQKTATVTGIPAPATPANVRVTAATVKSVTLAWDTVNGATGYVVYRAKNDGTFDKLDTCSGPTYTDSKVQTAETAAYCYKVAASRTCYPTDLQSGLSNPVCAQVACSGSVTIDSATADPPVAIVGDEVQFDVTAHGACPSAALTYTWDWGDGSDPGAGAHATHTYGDVGTYTVTVTATDGAASDTRQITLKVDWSGYDNEPGPGTCTVCLQQSDDLDSTIDAGSGNLHIEMGLPGAATRSMPLAPVLSFNSQSVEPDRALGSATFTHDVHLGVVPVKDRQHKTTTNRWFLADGDGHRTDFGDAGAAPVGEPGTLSALVAVQGGYQLRNAGPPGDLHGAGTYTYTFNALGQLVQIDDGFGSSQTLQYSGTHLLSVRDVSTQRQMTFNYSGDRVSQIVTNDGQTGASLSYNGGKLSGVTVQGNGGPVRSIALAYNGDGSIQSFTQDGNAATRVSLSYTAHASAQGGDPILLANATDATRTTHLDWSQPPATGAARTVQVTNARGGMTRIDYNAFGDVIKVVAPAPAGATQPTTYTFSYGGNRQLTGGAINGTPVATVEYSAQGLVSGFTDGLSHHWSVDYAGLNPVSVTGPSSQQISFGYDDPAVPYAPTSVTDELGHVSHFTYNAAGQVTSIAMPAGSPVGPMAIQYDERPGSISLGLPLVITDGNGDIATADAYDAVGNLLSFSTYPIHGNTATRYTTSLTYDAQQRLTSVTNPDGTVAQEVYNGSRLDHTIDEAGTQFNYLYCGPCGMLTGVTGPMGWSVGIGLDADRNPISYTDPRGNATTFSYGAADELTGATYPDGTGYSLLYDDLGRVREQTNGRGHRTVFAHDAADKVTDLTFPDSTDHAIHFSYNPDDMLVGMTDAVGSTSFSRYANGQLQTVTYDYRSAGLPDIQQLAYTYYPDGRRETLTWTGGNQLRGRWTYTYDAGGRMTGLVNHLNEVTSWTYDGEGKLTGQVNANGTSVSLGYNQARGWPTSMTYFAGTSPFAYFGLQHDTVGKLTSVDEGNSRVTTYQYDGLSRLTSAVSTTGTSHAYTYDLAGNATSIDGTSLSYDAANKISGVQYDGDGNLTRSQWSDTLPPHYRAVCTWNDLGQLRSFEGRTGGTTYRTYDGLGRLTAEYMNAFLIYDGQTIIGRVKTNGTPVYTSYTWGANGLVSLHDDGTGRSLWYVFGPQGETRALTGSTGAIADTYNYTPYGQITDTTGPDYNPFRFGGQYGGYTLLDPMDTASGGAILSADAPILFGYRWYAPWLGRWLSRDHAGYAGGANLYEYCGGDPVNYVDETGDTDHKGRGGGAFRNTSDYHVECAFDWRHPGDGKRYSFRLMVPPGYETVGAAVDVDYVKMPNGTWYHLLPYVNALTDYSVENDCGHAGQYLLVAPRAAHFAAPFYERAARFIGGSYRECVRDAHGWPDTLNPDPRSSGVMDAPEAERKGFIKRIPPTIWDFTTGAARRIIRDLTGHG